MKGKRVVVINSTVESLILRAIKNILKMLGYLKSIKLSNASLGDS